MARYLFAASYTQQGLDGMLKEGAASRVGVIEGLAASLGGSVEAMYWAFGPSDVIVVAELPDNAAAAAFSTTVGAAGVASVTTTTLLTADEVDQARSLQPRYRPPGA